MYDGGSHDEQMEFREVKAKTDVDAAIKVANILLKTYTTIPEMYVWEGVKPTPIQVERSVKLKVKDPK